MSDMTEFDLVKAELGEILDPEILELLRSSERAPAASSAPAVESISAENEAYVGWVEPYFLVNRTI